MDLKALIRKFILQLAYISLRGHLYALQHIVVFFPLERSTWQISCGGSSFSVF